MKRKIIKNLKKIFQKTCAIIMILGMMVTSLGLPPFINVLADTNNTKLVLDTNNNAISIDSTDTNMLIYKIDDTIVGTVKVKLDDDYQTPIINDGKAEFILPEYNNETYQVVVEVTPEEGYQVGQFLMNWPEDSHEELRRSIQLLINGEILVHPANKSDKIDVASELVSPTVEKNLHINIQKKFLQQIF